MEKSREQLKKEREKQILSIVYDVDKCVFDEKDSEKPDFKFRLDNGDKFGVEITEFYSSETEAKLMKDKDYKNDLLYNDGRIHKKDEDIIEKGTLFFMSYDESGFYEVPGLLRHLPSETDYLNKLAKEIGEKNKKYANYSESLKYINLIVNEVDSIFMNTTKENVFRTYFNDNVIKAVSESPFREIFLLAKVDNEVVRIPMKLNIFNMRIFLFNKVIESVDGSLLNNKTDEIKLLTKYFYSSGVFDISIKYRKKKLEIVYSNYKIIFDKRRALILDYHKFAIPEFKIKYTTNHTMPKKFTQKEKEILNNHKLYYGFIFDSKHWRY
ncbi:hypothetical protein [Priestia megaterium]|uniref:hypothetical protein n=1 Tax=Priestia megaterium TaxID=1404 RepID=UPI0011290768|nr:hypothetical protein [Priestia megaterium]TPF18093.1 hypothetical protein CBE78_02365 [Priestia megaterium]TPF22200.1 hypothetical protein CBE79_04870 [Priestia megaterium]